ncbi:MAG: XdhC/CoxI family protein [Dehalococcoidia bacterium]|nr:MAG: XdhC/CoxI family protein [Dehalococcoidia bacterium]
MNNDLLDEMIQILERGERFALATLVDARGSTPQKAGARLLARADGSAAGTLGGGCIEASAREAAAEVLASGAPRVLDFELTEDIAVDYGLACGGTERILIAPASAIDVDVARALRGAGHRRGAVLTVVQSPEGAAGRTVAVWGDGVTDGDAVSLDAEALSAARALIAERHPRPRVVRAASGAEYFIEPRQDAAEVIVVGGGHVGLAVAMAARFAGYRIAVIDDRADFANAERFPDAGATVVGDIEQALAAYPVTETSAVVIVTRGHKYDYQALAVAARSPAFYVGLMGSRRKVALIYRQLIDDGIPPERLRDIHAPIGLNIGAVTPEEIALSIVAEITMARLGGDGAPMKADERIIERARARARA